MAPMRGLLAYGAYVPYARLDRKSIGEALGASAGSGTRAVASYDEDSTSMGVEAARSALRGAGVTPEVLYFATSDPPYLDKTNANAIHAALDLPASTMAVDVMGSVRSAAVPCARRSTRACRRWPCSPTFAAACPAALTKRTVATPRWRFSSARATSSPSRSVMRR